MGQCAQSPYRFFNDSETVQFGILMKPEDFEQCSPKMQTNASTPSEKQLLPTTFMSVTVVAKQKW